MWQCDICREGVHIKPAYNCKDCTFNLCITCFETKSGELQGVSQNLPRSVVCSGRL